MLKADCTLASSVGPRRQTETNSTSGRERKIGKWFATAHQPAPTTPTRNFWLTSALPLLTQISCRLHFVLVALLLEPLNSREAFRIDQGHGGARARVPSFVLTMDDPTGLSNQT